MCIIRPTSRGKKKKGKLSKISLEADHPDKLTISVKLMGY
jgi:hypothetical protein